ncbi:MAG TPA: DUF2905 domain-containing protein [Candidatus Sumerlaeota bacterium]|nr:DUF2905 domain-containing protein [Candidatus Sumerlaeota bacterium]
MNYENAGKYLLVAGAVLIVIGGIAWGLGKAGFKGLPGDINIQRGNWSFSFPIVTCIVISVLLTLVINFLNRK